MSKLGVRMMISNGARDLDVRFSNDDVMLSGTLVLPQTVGPHPAVVFIHGSRQEYPGTLEVFRRQICVPWNCGSCV